MKFFALIFLITVAPAAWGQSQTSESLKSLRGTLTGRDFGLENALLDRAEEEVDMARRTAVKNAKFFIINGETKLARQTLNQLLKGDLGKLKPLVYRFLALADFQEGQWKSALRNLSVPELTAYPYYGRICPLKVVLQIAAKETNKLKDNWERCKLENAKDTDSKDMVWMDTLVTLTLTPRRTIARRILSKYNPINLSNEQLKSMLKLSLYLNLESLMVDALEGLDYSVVKDEELRVLMAQIYFRRGRLADAWRMMEDIPNPNIENMKGNLWLLRGKDELAFAQFKLALQQKSNSHNAVERALPLAWFLQQWKEGIKLAERIYTHEKNRQEQLTTIAAFSVANDQWKDAFERLELVHQRGGSATAQEVTQLSTYVALRQNDTKSFRRYGKSACEGGDTMACWLMATEFTWPELPSLTSQTQDPGLEAAIALDKELLNGEAEAFKDDTFIDQRDINELDDSLIKLVKSP